MSMTDAEVETTVARVRKTLMGQGKHPEEAVHEFLRHNTDPLQRQRLYGCRDPLQSARRATHGDAFRY